MYRKCRPRGPGNFKTRGNKPGSPAPFLINNGGIPRSPSKVFPLGSCAKTIWIWKTHVITADGIIGSLLTPIATAWTPRHGNRLFAFWWRIAFGIFGAPELSLCPSGCDSAARLARFFTRADTPPRGGASRRDCGFSCLSSHRAGGVLAVQCRAVKTVYEQASSLNCERFVFSSTYSNYGLSENNLPVDESAPLNPQSLTLRPKSPPRNFC